MSLIVQAFFHADTGTVSYVVADPASGAAAVVDSVLDYEPNSGTVSSGAVEAISAYLHEHGLRLAWILETHVHADHLSGAAWLKSRHGGQIAIGEGVRGILRHWQPIFAGSGVQAEPVHFDRLVVDGERLPLGGLSIEVMATPGHTDSCVSYRIDDAVFVGDTLFMPDVGTARCDFPGGDALVQHHSLRLLLSLPDETRVFTGHDYPPEGRAPAWEASVAEQRAGNAMHPDADADSYVAARRARDAKLMAPRLLMPALQVNLRGGRLPEPDAAGRRYLLIPLRGAAI
ncbi:MAG: MBL fold metallo-hydrolase [Gammaproteobacteria bacterium]|nr:MBL fold metallo-hydrolase [Gammaproteobacteria bacterium]